MSKRHVFLFQRDFVPKILAGTKDTTIRPIGSRNVQIGDILDMRFWRGKPYRSKQVKFAESELTRKVQVLINEPSVTYFSKITHTESHDAWLQPFAQCDGFASWKELVTWFKKQHDLPFTGQLYGWNPAQLKPLITLDDL